MNNAFAVKNSRGETWFLHSKMVSLRGGKQVKIYFFMKASQKEQAEERNCVPEPQLPETHSYRENPRNGYMVVYRKESEQRVTR